MKRLLMAVTMSAMLLFAVIGCGNDTSYENDYDEVYQEKVIEEQIVDDPILEEEPIAEPVTFAPFTGKFIAVSISAESEGLTIDQTGMAEDLMGVPIGEISLEFFEDGRVIQHVGSSSTDISWGAEIEGNPSIDIGTMPHVLVLDDDTLTVTTSMGTGSMIWTYERISD